MPNIHIVMPFYRPDNLEDILSVYEGQAVTLYPIMTAKESINFNRDWVKPVICPDYPEGLNPVNFKLNYFIQTQPIEDEDYYWWMNDDDSLEPDVIPTLKKQDNDIIFISMKRGHHTPKDAHPDSQHPTNTLFARPGYVRLCCIGGEQMIVKGKIYKTLKYHDYSACADGMMAMYLKNHYPVRYMEKLYVLFNYFEEGRWDKSPTRAILDNIAESVDTWHHDHHILLDYALGYPEDYKLTYAEIGCYAGASSCLMLQRPNTDVIAIDAGMVPFPIVRGNVERFNQHDNNFTYILGNSHEKGTKDTFESVAKKADILFIDGGHEYTDVLADFMVYERYVPVGGTIVFDDYGDTNYPGVRKAIEDLQSEYPNYDWIGAKGNCYVAQKRGVA